MKRCGHRRFPGAPAGRHVHRCHVRPPDPLELTKQELSANIAMERLQCRELVGHDSERYLALPRRVLAGDVFRPGAAPGERRRPRRGRWPAVHRVLPRPDPRLRRQCRRRAAALRAVRAGGGARGGQLQRNPIPRQLRRSARGVRRGRERRHGPLHPARLRRGPHRQAQHRGDPGRRPGLRRGRAPSMSATSPRPTSTRSPGRASRSPTATCRANLCVPSRAGLLTGRYPQEFGFYRNPRGPTRPASACPAARRRWPRRCARGVTPPAWSASGISGMKDARPPAAARLRRVLRRARHRPPLLRRDRRQSDPERARRRCRPRATSPTRSPPRPRASSGGAPAAVLPLRAVHRPPTARCRPSPRCWRGWATSATPSGGWSRRCWPRSTRAWARSWPSCGRRGGGPDRGGVPGRQRLRRACRNAAASRRQGDLLGGRHPRAVHPVLAGPGRRRASPMSSRSCRFDLFATFLRAAGGAPAGRGGRGRPAAVPARAPADARTPTCSGAGGPTAPPASGDWKLVGNELYELSERHGETQRGRGQPGGGRRPAPGARGLAGTLQPPLW